MNVLGIETSTSRSHVCLGSERGLLASAALGRSQAHGEYLIPAVEFCLEQAGLRMDAIHGIAVDMGPGLYTGMRVGIATAQTLAHARRLPVVGLNALDLLAFGVRYARPDRAICAAVDARRQELFWAFYRPAHGGMQRVTELRVGPPAKLAAEIEATGDDVLCVGDGASAHRQMLEASGAICSSAWSGYASAEALVELALPRFVREETQRPEELRAIYLRRADARINWQKRGAAFGGTSTPAPRAGADR